MSTRKQKTSSSYRRFFAAERLFCLFWLIIRFCQNCVERKFEYVFLFDADEYKKYYFYRCYCDLAFFLAEINRINADREKLDKKILETEAKIFRLRRQRKLLLCRLRKLGDREARNIEDVQKTEKEAEFYKNAILGLSVPDNLFFTVSEADCVLAAVSEK